MTTRTHRQLEAVSAKGEIGHGTAGDFNIGDSLPHQIDINTNTSRMSHLNCYLRCKDNLSRQETSALVNVPCWNGEQLNRQLMNPLEKGRSRPKYEGPAGKEGDHSAEKSNNNRR